MAVESIYEPNEVSVKPHQKFKSLFAQERTNEVSKHFLDFLLISFFIYSTGIGIKTGLFIILIWHVGGIYSKIIDNKNGFIIFVNIIYVQISVINY